MKPLTMSEEALEEYRKTAGMGLCDAATSDDIENLLAEIDSLTSKCKVLSDLLCHLTQTSKDALG